VKRARFVAAARREFLAEVVYYNKEEPGLGVRFAAAVEDATARALAFPRAGARPKILGGSFSRTFLLLLYIGPMPMGSLSLRSRITRVVRATGNHVFRTANKSLQPTGYAGG